MNKAVIDALQSRFGSGNFNFYAAEGGLPAVKLVNSFGSAAVLLHGAHVIDYTPAGAVPVLWMSEKSMFTAGEPIRGGIPVCWPWFGADVTGKFGGDGIVCIDDEHIIVILVAEQIDLGVDILLHILVDIQVIGG